MGHHNTFRTKHRRNHRSAYLRRIGVLILAATALWYGARSLSQNPTGPVAQQVSTIPAQKPVSEEQTLRAVYPYSVIPGGVRSIGELKNAIVNDPVVSLQYVNFNLSHARVTRLDQDRFAYVSYRRGNQLFWTTRKLKIPRNELVITDGEHTARSRCGNLVSETASYPISSDEPSDAVLDMPQDIDPSQTPNTFESRQAPDQSPPIFITQGPIFSGGNSISNPPTSSVIADPGPHPSGGAPSSFPPTVFFPPWKDGPPVTPTPPVVSVPEPSSLALLAISLPLLFVWLYRKRANAN